MHQTKHCYNLRFNQDFINMVTEHRDYLILVLGSNKLIHADDFTIFSAGNYIIV